MKAMHHPYLAALLLTMSARAAADRLADPTRPPQASDTTNGPLQESVRVEAVLRSKERDLAIVNGKIVPATENAVGHSPAHAAETDKSNLHGALLFQPAGAGLLAADYGPILRSVTMGDCRKQAIPEGIAAG